MAHAIIEAEKSRDALRVSWRPRKAHAVPHWEPQGQQCESQSPKAPMSQGRRICGSMSERENLSCPHTLVLLGGPSVDGRMLIHAGDRGSSSLSLLILPETPSQTHPEMTLPRYLGTLTSSHVDT